MKKHTIYKYSLHALGTIWWFEIYDHVDSSFIDNIFAKIEIIIRNFEKDYSRFLPDSIITQLNENKILLNPPDELIQMIQRSKFYYEISEGVFNIAVGSRLENIGYDKDYSFKVKKEETKIESFEKAILSFSDKKIQISNSTKIDLGGIGKGWLVDKVANILRAENIQYFFINAGGDILATSNHFKPIEFTLENPFDTSEFIGKIQIENESIASSSTNRRRWKDENTGKVYTHIIDTSGIDNENPRVALYTQAKNTTLADVASTILFICPLEKLESLAKKLKVEFMVVFADGNFVKSKGYKGEV